jgi:tetratricopeptide (TPR) repeat protein
MFRLLGRVDEALEIQERLMRTQSGGEDGFVYEELAECLLVLGRADEARAHFARAHAMLSQDPWLVRNEAARLERLAKFARGAA